MTWAQPSARGGVALDDGFLPAGATALAAGFRHAPVPLLLVDGAGRMLAANDCATQLFELPHPLPSTPLWALMGDDGPQAESQFRDRLLTGRFPWQLERLWEDRLGDRHRVAWTVSRLPVARGDGSPASTPAEEVWLVCTALDVTGQRKTEAMLRQKAETDPLTGLANRSAFEQLLPVHLDPTAGLGCGLLYCDLDGFKQINDTHGHAAGDELLVETAKRLLGSVRTGDVVARMGGDEFVVLLPADGAIQVRALAARMERAIARPYRLSAGLVRVGISIGIRVADAGEDPAGVLDDADAAMYAVKARRRARLAHAGPGHAIQSPLPGSTTHPPAPHPSVPAAQHERPTG